MDDQTEGDSMRVIIICAAIAVNIAVAAVAIATHNPLSLIAAATSTVLGYNYLARRRRATRKG